MKEQTCNHWQHVVCPRSFSESRNVPGLLESSRSTFTSPCELFSVDIASSLFSWPREFLCMSTVCTKSLHYDGHSRCGWPEPRGICSSGAQIAWLVFSSSPRAGRMQASCSRWFSTREKRSSHRGQDAPVTSRYYRAVILLLHLSLCTYMTTRLLLMSWCYLKMLRRMHAMYPPMSLIEFDQLKLLKFCHHAEK